MSRPTTTSLALVAIAAVFCTAAFCFRLLVPVQAPVDPRLDTLRAEGMQLAGFSDAAAANAEAKFAELDRKLWTPSGFDHWRKATVAEGWTVQDLGPAGTASLRARRYAFQRPNATDREWPEITALLGNLEKTPCISVQSVTLSVASGYAESRHFSQCLMIAVFYFAGDEAATPPSVHP